MNKRQMAHGLRKQFKVNMYPYASETDRKANEATSHTLQFVGGVFDWDGVEWADGRSGAYFVKVENQAFYYIGRINTIIINYSWTRKFI